MKYFGKFQGNSFFLVLSRLITILCTMTSGIVLAREMSYETRGNSAYIIMAIGLSLSFGTASKVESIFRQDSDSVNNSHGLWNMVPSILFLSIILAISNVSVSLVLFLLSILNLIFTYLNSITLARIYIDLGAKKFFGLEVTYNVTLLVTILMVVILKELSLFSYILCSTISEVILLFTAIASIHLARLDLHKEFASDLRFENPFTKARTTAFIEANVSQLQLMAIGAIFGMQNLSLFVVATGAVVPILLFPRALQPIILSQSQNIYARMHQKHNIKKIGISAFVMLASVVIYARFLYYAIPLVYGSKYDLLRTHVLVISIFGFTSALSQLSRTISRGLKLFDRNLVYNLSNLFCIFLVAVATKSSRNAIDITLLSISLLNIVSFFFIRNSRLGDHSIVITDLVP